MKSTTLILVLFLAVGCASEAISTAPTSTPDAEIVYVTVTETVTVTSTSTVTAPGAALAASPDGSPDAMAMASGPHGGVEKLATPDASPAPSTPDAQLVASADGGNTTIGWTFTDYGASPDAGPVKVVSDAGIAWKGYADQWQLVLPTAAGWQWCNSHGWCIGDGPIPTCETACMSYPVIMMASVAFCIPELQPDVANCQRPTPKALEACWPSHAGPPFQPCAEGEPTL
jgi:hypothetical protein